MKTVWSLFIFLLICGTSFAQVDFGYFSDLSAQIDIDDESDSTDCIITPVGFSPDGKLAYIEWRYEDAMMEDMPAELTVHFVITDLVTDRELYRRYFIHHGHFDENDMYDVLRENSADFQRTLSEYRIHMLETPSAVFYEFPYIGFTIARLGADGELAGRVIEIRSPKGRKKIADLSADGYRRIRVIGLLKSPYEARIAVLLAVYGDDGCRLKPVGCHLSTGYN
ncbi:MAG TPA: hypothetical protein ENN69_02570 [Spirochaetia bacterium]|nr:hypothetical protein [Spirochaetia bacterium]